LQSLSPGVVQTEIIGDALGQDLSPEAALEMWNGFPHLKSKDIADSIIYLLGTPPHVLICELLIRPMNETF
jgi:NADP-dependent 3-hydroxy acid dehydrogenase YdfG